MPAFRTDCPKIPAPMLQSLSIHAILIVVATTGLVSCASHRLTLEPSSTPRPVVERLGEKQVRIRWPASYATGPVLIYAGPTPENIDRSQPMAIGYDGSIRLLADRHHPDVDNDHRLYYELQPARGGPSWITAERR